MMREYIGARYIPRFCGPFDVTQQYDALDVVDNGSGTSYIARKTVPPGTALTDTEFWALYGASSGAIIDLQGRLTTAEGNITSLDGRMTAAEGNITANSSAILANYNTRRKRNFIVIGDSFGAGVVGGGQPRTTGWIEAFKQMWMDEGHGKVYYNIVSLPGLAGFASSLPFLTILTDDIETQISDFNEITDIVVLGGSNDISIAGATIQQAVKDFCDHCKVNFPYARVAIGVYGSHKNDLMSDVYPNYRACISYGAEFITDLFNLICDPVYISDGTHLTAAGYAAYNHYVCQAILYGKVEYSFKLGFAGDNPSTEPMLRFIVQNDKVLCAVTALNSTYPFNNLLASFTTDTQLGSYTSLPLIYLKSTAEITVAEVYRELTSHEFYAGGKATLRLNLSNGRLTGHFLMFATGGTPLNQGIIINNDWHVISGIDY